MKEIIPLIKKAQEAMKRAYAPYSGYQVGAALLTTTGRIFTGCNIENASYGLTVCAERVAIFNAITNGCYHLKSIAITAKDKKGKNTTLYPCGACLQVMAEFAPNLTVIIADGRNRPKVIKLKELLPNQFKLKEE